MRLAIAGSQPHRFLKILFRGSQLAPLHRLRTALQRGLQRIVTRRLTLRGQCSMGKKHHGEGESDAS